MSPEETAIDFSELAFPQFERHFQAHANRLSLAFLRETNPRAAALWTDSEPAAELANVLDVLVSPDGSEAIALTVGEHRGVYLRLELRARRAPLGWTSSPITTAAGSEADAINPLVDLTEQLEASGWRHHLIEEGELVED